MSNKSECKIVDIEDENKQKTDLKVYRREYYRRLYHSNPEYKEMKKKYNNDLYVHKTIRCVECYKRHKFEELTAMDYKFDKDKFVCPSCLPENKSIQIKSSRGRPRKVLSNSEIIIA